MPSCVHIIQIIRDLVIPGLSGLSLYYLFFLQFLSLRFAWKVDKQGGKSIPHKKEYFYINKAFFFSTIIFAVVDMWIKEQYLNDCALSLRLRHRAIIEDFFYGTKYLNKSSKYLGQVEELKFFLSENCQQLLDVILKFF